MSKTNEKPVFTNPLLKVSGFTPEDFLQKYVNSNGEVLKRLPFAAQLEWFKRVYPESKVSVETRPGNGIIIAHARVYANRLDPVDAYIAEGEASRGPNPEMPSVNPRIWAQTAAISVALRYAGFGLEFDLAGDEPESVTCEFDALFDDDGETPTPSSTPVPTKPTKKSKPKTKKAEKTEEKTPDTQPDLSAMSDEEKVEYAACFVLPTGKYKGKMLKNVVAENNRYVPYILEQHKEGESETELYKCCKILAEAAERLNRG